MKETSDVSRDYVKGVGAQDRRATATKLVALAGNGAGGFCPGALWWRGGGRRER